MFTQEEIAYLQSQPLARLATVDPHGQPDVSPVGFEFDGTYLYVGGHNVTATRKVKNVQAGNPRVALVIDDLISIQPWRPRGIRIYGSAEIVEREGRVGHGPYLRIKPEVSWSWNVNSQSANPGAPRHKTVHMLRA